MTDPIELPPLPSPDPAFDIPPRFSPEAMRAYALDAIKAHMAGFVLCDAEPVAWIAKTGHGTYVETAERRGAHTEFWSPLYAATKEPGK